MVVVSKNIKEFVNDLRSIDYHVENRWIKICPSLFDMKNMPGFLLEILPFKNTRIAHPSFNTERLDHGPFSESIKNFFAIG